MQDDEFRRRLATEVEVWRKEQIISEAQAVAIRDRYQAAVPEETSNRLAHILAFLGATLLGIGVIIFFAANWQQIPGWVKLVSIYAAVVAADGFGFRLRYETASFRGTGNALLFLGALLFGAAIFLIAQGLHINADEPFLLLLWAIGLLPMAYLLASRAMIVLIILDLAVALGWELAFWLDHLTAFCAAYLVFGVLLYSLSMMQGAYLSTRLFRLPYGVCGLFFIFASLFPLTFDLSPDGGATDLPPAALRFSILLGIAGAAVLMAALRSRSSRTSLPEAGTLLLLLLIGSALFFLGAAGTGAAILINLLLLGLIVGAITAGYTNKEPAWINVGTLFFALQTIARYFDWFWDLMPRSLFFIGAGALLLLGGLMLERTRRRIVQTVQEIEESE